LVQNETKQIVVSDRDKVPADMLKDPLTVNMDSIMKFYDAPVLVTSTQEIEHYRLNQRMGEVTQIDFIFDLRNEFLKKVMYATKAGDYVVIEFIIHPNSWRQEKKTFNNDTYFIWEGKKIKAGKGYAGYSVNFLSADER
jgi:hypothetical protein